MAQSGGNSHSLAADKVGASLSGGVAMMMRTIDLMTVRMQLGERFPAISERLHAQLQKDLKQALTGFGWFWPMGDLFYRIVLWGITESEADALVQRLLKQLHSNLRSLKFDTTGLFIPVNAAHLDRRGRPRIDAIQSLEEGDVEVAVSPPVEQKGPAFAFEPIWNVRKGVVSAFRCIRLNPASAAPATLGEPLIAELQEVTRWGIEDQAVLQHAITEWSKLPPESPCLMIVPVRFETLASAGPRRDYLGLCGDMPHPLRRLLIFEIEQIPDGVMAERLLDVTRYVKSFCRAVMTRVSLEFQHFEAINKAGIPIVACQIGSARNEQKSLQLMERFVERAERHKLQSAVFGIRSVSLTTAALGAGFVYIGGEAVSTPARAPRGLLQ